MHAGAFTRMFVDLNRGPEHPDVVPTVSYGASVPGNAHLVDRRSRGAASRCFTRRTGTRCAATSPRGSYDRGEVLHFSSHSVRSGARSREQRTFEVGVLYDPAHAFEAALAERLLFQLRGAGLDVRANQPYSGVGPAICTSLRTELADQRYAGIQLETSHA